MATTYRPSVPLLPQENRIGCAGKPVSVELLSKIVQTKLANPEATQLLVAELAGTTPATVAVAYATPWAKSKLEVLGTRTDILQKALLDTARDSVTYSHKAVRRGVHEIDKDSPKESILRAATASAQLILKGTILPERVQITAHYPESADFQALTDPEAQALLEAYKGEGETGDTPVLQEGESFPPTSESSLDPPEPEVVD